MRVRYFRVSDARVLFGNRYTFGLCLSESERWTEVQKRVCSLSASDSEALVFGSGWLPLMTLLLNSFMNAKPAFCMRMIFLDDDDDDFTRSGAVFTGGAFFRSHGTNAGEAFVPEELAVNR